MTDILSFEYFHSRVMDLSRNTKTYKAAFEAANREFEENYGEPRYAGYNSFKVMHRVSGGRKSLKSKTISIVQG